MTQTFKLLTTSAAFALIAGAAQSQSISQNVIETIVDQLSGEGFERIEIDVERDEIDVDAYGSDYDGAYTFSLGGQLLAAEIIEDDSDGDDYDDDDDRFGDDDDDDDDDRDDEDDGDDDHDDDNDGDDDDNDGEDDND